MVWTTSLRRSSLRARWRGSWRPTRRLDGDRPADARRRPGHDDPLAAQFAFRHDSAPTYFPIGRSRQSSRRVPGPPGRQTLPPLGVRGGLVCDTGRNCCISASAPPAQSLHWVDWNANQPNVTSGCGTLYYQLSPALMCAIRRAGRIAAQCDCDLVSPRHLFLCRPAPRRG